MARASRLLLPLLLVGACEKQAPAPPPNAAVPVKIADPAEERRLRLQKRLDAQRLYNIAWSGNLDVSEAVARLREATGFNLVMTVEARERIGAAPVALAAHDETTRAVLDRFAHAAGLQWEVRSGVVLLSLATESLPGAEVVGIPAPEDPPEIRRMRDLVALRRVDLAFERATLAQVLESLTARTGIEWKDDTGLPAREVSLSATDVTLAEALDLLVLEAFAEEPVTYEITPGGVRFTRPREEPR